MVVFVFHLRDQLLETRYHRQCELNSYSGCKFMVTVGNLQRLIFDWQTYTATLLSSADSWLLQLMDINLLPQTRIWKLIVGPQVSTQSLFTASTFSSLSQIEKLWENISELLWWFCFFSLAALIFLAPEFSIQHDDDFEGWKGTFKKWALEGMLSSADLFLSLDLSLFVSPAATRKICFANFIFLRRVIMNQRRHAV